MIKIGTIGYNYIHGTDFTMDRPNGPGCWLLLLIKTSANFELDGHHHLVKKNSFVLLSPEIPCKYSAAEEFYTDDWMYIEMDEHGRQEIESLGIPLNKIIHLGNIDELSQIMHIMTYEQYSTEINHTEIQQGYLNILLLKLSRIIKSQSAITSGAYIERNYKFTQLRTEIYSKPQQVSDIDTMAHNMGMSRSGFQHLYKKMFGVSVINDVISSRIEQSKRLLASTNLTVKEIAERCGYANEYNFMRQFRDRTGKTPTEYRRCI